jgi:deazaflavin-dependent oxidoreductase (nitroreductase family)
MPHLDRATYRLTGRQGTLTAFMTGLPVILLTTAGSRTGKGRTVTVIGFPITEGLAVVAGNFGKPKDPAWCVNLRSNPHATIEQGSISRPVIARELSGEERECAWRQCLPRFPSGAAYAERAAPRVIAVFRLDPAC